mgnify:CR=1 FL=1
MQLGTEHGKSSLKALTLAAIGIVYGDIGTSPLYTMKEIFSAEHGLAVNPDNIFGVVSLILWGLIIIVALKYVTLILRAHNRGEGGIMALTALALADVIVEGSLARRESRGSHFRTDFPDADSAQARRTAWAGDAPHHLERAAMPAPTNNLTEAV